MRVWVGRADASSIAGLISPLLTSPVCFRQSSEQQRHRSSWFNPAGTAGDIDRSNITSVGHRLGGHRHHYALRWSTRRTAYALRSAGIPIESEFDFDGRERTQQSGIATGTVHRFRRRTQYRDLFDRRQPGSVSAIPQSSGQSGQRRHITSTRPPRCGGNPRILEQGPYSRVLVESAASLPSIAH